MAGQVAVCRPHRIGDFRLQAEQGVPAVVGTVQAGRGAETTTAATTFGVTTQTGADHAAFHVLLQDDVDHAGDGVRAIQRGLATGQDFNALDQLHRNAADVVEHVRTVVQRRIVGHRAAIDQIFDVAGGQTKQAQGFGTLGERSRALVVLHATGGEAALLQHFRHVAEAAGLNVLGRNDGDRNEGFDLGLRDQRTGHGDLVQILRLFVGLLLGVGLGGSLVLRIGSDRQHQGCGKRQRQLAANNGIAVAKSHGNSFFLETVKQNQLR